VREGRPAPLRVAVIGTGYMGENHLRNLHRMRDVELVAVVDVNEQAAQAAATRYQCEAFSRVEDVIDRADIATVATPSVHHADIGVFLLRNGIHCLVEKPLAVDTEGCLALIEAAEESGMVLLPGHVERFNPAVQQLRNILSGKAVVSAFEARRLSAVQRVVDIDVVLDLMIHDLDIVLSLIRSPLVNVHADGVHVGEHVGSDYVVATLSFADGSLATLIASRMTQHRIRELYVTTDFGFISLDYSTQNLSVHRKSYETPMPSLNSEVGGYTMELATERVLVRAAEPLLVELQHFVEAVHKREALEVTGTQALETLQVAWDIARIAGKR
jgi:predicted dehydrogenase